MGEVERDPDSSAGEGAALIRVLAHPFRLDILESLGVGGPATLRELSERLGRPRSTVRDHLAKLHEFSLVEIVAERERRGARERVYRVNRDRGIISEEQLAASSPQVVRRVQMTVVTRLFDGITRAVRQATCSTRPDHVFCWVPGRVDEQGWRQLAALHGRAAEDAQRVLDESEARLEASGEDAISIGAGQVVFELPPLDAAD